MLLRCYDFRFKTSRNSHIIEVNLYDEIDFICPYTPFEFNESKQEFYVIYQVRRPVQIIPAVRCLLRNVYTLHDFNPFKPSGVEWLHFKAFSAILV